MKEISLISVIVVTYNQEETIARALDSILMQECHLPFEIVIGEDYSTDHTKDICEEYARRYPNQIRLFCNQQNKGVTDNYFDCLLACKGELIADCAGDDFWIDKQKLEKESRIMESDESVTLVHTGWCYYNEQTRATSQAPTTPFHDRITDGQKILEAILTQTHTPVVHLCTALYRSSTILKEYHAHTSFFRNPEWGCEDLQTIFFLAKNGRIAYLPDITLYYSQKAESISSSHDERKLFVFYKRVTNLSYCLSREYGIRSAQTESFFNQRSFELLMHAFRAYDKHLRNEAIASQKEWGAPSTLQSDILKAVTSNTVTWAMALYARKIFVRIKQALH